MNLTESIKVMRLRDGAVMPERATCGSAGLDLFACVEGSVVLRPGQCVLIPTGIAVELPSRDLVAFIFARSGISVRHGVALANGVGVVDSDYRGEICVGLRNFGDESYVIEAAMRIAQMVVMPVCSLPLVQVEALSETTRGSGGFGSTGA